jgi:hypothetical protein
MISHLFSSYLIEDLREIIYQFDDNKGESRITLRLHQSVTWRSDQIISRGNVLSDEILDPSDILILSSASIFSI